MSRTVRKLWHIITQTFYKNRFRNIGSGSLICKPLQLDSVSSISIGDFVYIAEGAWLMGNIAKSNSISIGSGTTIGHFVHIVGLHSVMIGNNVLIADKVFISDCTHNYEDIRVPIINQDVKELSPVVIGADSWLGENVCVCGASVGKHCVIGANSVVIYDIPDYSVAVGSPARVVKRFDFEKKEWVKV